MLILAVALLILGLGLVFLEILLPSGGVISLAAAAAFIGSLFLAFSEGTVTGYVFLSVIIVCLPVSVAWAFKILPKTRIGKKMILTPVDATAQEKGAAGVSVEDYDGLLGKTGITATELRPSGIAEIEGQRYSVVAKGTIIDKNTQIIVDKIEGNNIFVEIHEPPSA